VAEDAYARGEVDNRDVSLLDAGGWAGTTAVQIEKWLEDLPLVAGIVDVVDWCQQRDLSPILGTLAWAPVGSYLQRRFAFAAVCGPRLAMIDGRFTGLVERHFDEYDKRDFVLRLADENRLAHDHCAAIGDSRSDAPLFMSVGFSIAFNASRELQSVASASTTSDDLREILPLLEGWQASL